VSFSDVKLSRMFLTLSIRSWTSCPTLTSFSLLLVMKLSIKVFRSPSKCLWAMLRYLSSWLIASSKWPPMRWVYCCINAGSCRPIKAAPANSALSTRFINNFILSLYKFSNQV